MSRKVIIRSGLDLISMATVLVLLFAATVGHAAARVEYYHTDALGSVVASTDESGNVLWRESYKPFGSRIQNEVSTEDNTPFYTGKPHDDVTGLSYFGARYYDPNIGRFLGVDPVGVDPANIHSFNRYAYANNNPYKYVDPDGRSSTLAAFQKGTTLNQAVEQGEGSRGAGLAVGVSVIAVGMAIDTGSDYINPVKGGIKKLIKKAVSSKGEAAKKLSKVKKSKKTEQIGDKFTKTTEVRPGAGPGQSRAEYTRYKNQDGEVIRTYKDSYDRGNKYQGRKPLRGGPEGRPQNQ